MEEIITNVDKLVEKTADNTDDGLKYARISYWILFSFAIVLCVLIFLILFCLSKKDTSKFTMARIILVVVAFFSLVFALLTFLILTGSAIFSGVCGLVRELNQD